MASPRNASYDTGRGGARIGRRQGGSDETGGGRRHPDAVHFEIPDLEVKQEGADGSRKGVPHSTSGHRGHWTRQESVGPGARSSGGKQHQRQNSRPISSELLQDILHKDPSELAFELGSLKGSVEAGINENTIDEERQRLIWRSLAYICDTINADHTVTMLLTLVSDSKLLKFHLPRYLIKLRSLKSDPIREIQTLLMDVFLVFKTMLQSLPSRMVDVNVSYTLLVDVVEGFKEVYPDHYKHLDPIKTDISHRIDALEKEEEKKRQMDRVHKNPPPDDFRQQTILPTSKELQAGYQPFLRPHISRGVYVDGDHYLDVQFRLLKEDFICPLRTGISEYLDFKRAHPNKRPRLHDIRIYEDVKLVQPIRDSSGVSHCFSFRLLPRVRWQISKRLMFGSLVLLSSDNFQTFLFGTVAKRDVGELEAGRVAVRLVDQGDASCLSGRTFVMAESAVFFEAYRPVLQGLQRMQSTSLPFTRYILGLSQNVYDPVYLRVWSDELPRKTQYEKMDISPVLKDKPSISLRGKLKRGLERTIEVTSDDAWPSVDDVKLDPSQLEAVKTALANELSVIQGPPGTGKTYVGLKIVHILVQNSHLWCTHEDPGPILLICYTNHALDQFLEGILQFCQNIVRVGSRSKSEALQQFNLNRLLGSSKRLDHAERVKNLRKEVDDAKKIVKRTQARMAGASMGIVRENELRPFMSSTHYTSLLTLSKLKMFDSWMVEWLLCDRQSDSTDWIQGLATPEANAEKELETEETEKMADATNSSLNIEHERDAIEAERMIEEDFETEMTEKMDDVPFLGLDLCHLPNNMDPALESYIAKKLLGSDRVDPTSIKKIRDVWRMSPNQRWVQYHAWLTRYIADLRIRLPGYENNYKHLCVQLEESKDTEKVQMLRSASIVGMTTTAAARNQQVLQRVRPKIVVVEEAAEVLEAHIITALHSSCQQLILIGDHQQLRPKPNVYMLAKKYHLDISLFERLINNGFPYSQLQLQHRMRPQIADIMRNHFYDVLNDYDSVKEFENIQGVTKNMFFIDHAQPQECIDDIQSHVNVHEANFLVALCNYLIQQGYETHQITILTAYTGQLFQFKQLMECNTFLGMKVTSIDNYQGEENDIILVSFVRSNNDGKIGFLGISNRLCVSLSRAKKGMFCIGNFTMFAENSDLWKGIVEDLKKTNSIGESLQLQCVNHPDAPTDVKTAKDFERVPNGGCMRPCETRLECGHVCRQLCHPTDRDHVLYQCNAPCLKTICENNHTCPNACSESCPISCSVTIKKILPCSHTCQTLCGQNIDDIRCDEDVEKTLQCYHKRILPCYESPDDLHLSCKIIVTRRLECGHTIKEKCSEQTDVESIVCEALTRKLLSCGHSRRVQCWKHPDDVLCTSECLKVLACGHKCRGKCGKPCTEKCEEMITRDDWPCKHKVTVKCSDRPSACYIKCEATLLCGHSCKGTCGDCSRGRFHLPCTEICERMLICGHKCTGKCGKPCPSCQQRCLQTCRHGQCRHPCSAPCDLCTKRCNWNCPHFRCSQLCCEPCDRPPCNQPCRKKKACGHPCIGLCGEICPTICRVCDKTELEQRLFGTETRSISRYIQLEDCGHVFEVKELDKKLGYRTEKAATSLPQFRKIMAPTCPRCGKPIKVSRRYGSLLQAYRSSLRCVVEKSQEEHAELEYEVAQTIRKIDSMICQSLTKTSSYLLKWPRDFQHMTSDHRKGICFRFKMISCVQSCSGSFIHRLQNHAKYNEIKDIKIVEILEKALQTSADESEDFLTRDTVELTKQQIHDTETELQRQIMLKESLVLFIKGAKDISQMEQLVPMLISETRFGSHPWRVANELLTKVYQRSGLIRSVNHSVCDLPEQVSSHLDVWRQCPVGHVLRSSECVSNICPACDNEKKQSEKGEQSSRDASRERPYQDRGQDRDRGRGRKRGTERGRGRGRGRGQNRRR